MGSDSLESAARKVKEKRRLKILCAGDFHGNHGIASETARKAGVEDVDMVILNGDIVEDFQPEGIMGLFKKENRPILFVRGNHESPATAEFLTKLYKETNLHAYAQRVGDVGFFGCGGANCGIDQLSDEEIFENLRRGFEYVKDLPIKVMVTHVHPSGSLMEKFSQFVQGSEGVTRAIKEFQPTVAFCGHVHEAEGIEEMIGKTKVMNAGKSGKVVEIELDGQSS